MTYLDDDDLAAHVADELTPLSEERLAEIRAMLTLTDVGDAQWNVITELLKEVDRLRDGEATLTDKLDAEADYGRGRIEHLLKRCAGLRHRAHVAEQREAALLAERERLLAVVRAVAGDAKE